MKASCSFVVPRRSAGGRAGGAGRGREVQVPALCTYIGPTPPPPPLTPSRYWRHFVFFYCFSLASPRPETSINSVNVSKFPCISRFEGKKKKGKPKLCFRFRKLCQASPPTK